MLVVSTLRHKITNMPKMKNIHTRASSCRFPSLELAISKLNEQGFKAIPSEDTYTVIPAEIPSGYPHTVHPSRNPLTLGILWEDGTMFLRYEGQQIPHISDYHTALKKLFPFEEKY